MSWSWRTKCDGDGTCVPCKCLENFPARNLWRKTRLNCTKSGISFSCSKEDDFNYIRNNMGSRWRSSIYFEDSLNQAFMGGLLSYDSAGPRKSTRSYLASLSSFLFPLRNIWSHSWRTCKSCSRSPPRPSHPCPTPRKGNSTDFCPQLDHSTCVFAWGISSHVVPCISSQAASLLGGIVAILWFALSSLLLESADLEGVDCVFSCRGHAFNVKKNKSNLHIPNSTHKYFFLMKFLLCYEPRCWLCQCL